MTEWKRPGTSSFEEFKKIRELDPKFVRGATTGSLPQCVKRVAQQVENAKKSMASFDLENGLIYYWRGVTIAAELNKKYPDLKNHPEFKRLFLDCLNESEKLLPVLEKMYPQTIAVPDKENGSLAQVRVITIHDKQYELVSPRNLVRELKGSPSMKILLIDTREDTKEEVRFEPESSLPVLPLPKSSLPPTGLTMKNLIGNLPMKHRHKLNHLEEYEDIVLMSEETDNDRQTLLLILTALTRYNTICKLKKDPRFLDGGFNAWKQSYPTFVHGEEVKMRILDGDDIAAQIARVRESKVPGFIYPDLTPKPSKPTVVRTPTPPPIPDIPSFPDESPSYPSLHDPSDIKPCPPIPDRLPRDIHPSSSTSSTSNNLNSISFPVVPSSSSIPSQPQIPSIPSRQFKPQSNNNQIRESAGGSTVSSIPSIDRSDKPSSRQINPERQTKLLGMYEVIRTYTMNVSNRSNTRSGFTGLINCGNTCFMNATLQALFHTELLQRIFTQENFASVVNPDNKMGTNGVIAASFSSIMDLIWSGQYSSLKITQFIRVFSSEVNSTLADGRQHDAHEFQTYLLDSLHEDTNMGKRKGFEQNYKGGALIAKEGEDFALKNKNFANSPIQRIFYLHTVSELECTTCRETSATFEESSCLSLELPSSSSSTNIHSSIQHHFSTTILSGDECWNCPRCKVPRQAKRSTSLWTLPHVLIVHLKRFSYQSGGYVKNQIDVNFPMSNFDLRPYFHPNAPNRNKTPTYSLYAVTNHTGSLSSGHYTSIVNIEGSWVKCDDETLSHFNPNNISQSGSFILFYKRDT